MRNPQTKRVFLLAFSPPSLPPFLPSFFLIEDVLIDFRERERKGERERERNINVREKHRSVASCTCPDRGTKPTT